jgi:hypothetical protein
MELSGNISHVTYFVNTDLKKDFSKNNFKKVKARTQFNL